jgi:hypothetical protein
MLRVHCMRLYYNLSDPMLEGVLYEIESMRHFASLKLREGSIVDTGIIVAPSSTKTKVPNVIRESTRLGSATNGKPA